MSADNEIGILICLDQCRVAECDVSAIWGLDPVMREPLPFQREVMRQAWSGENVKSCPTEQAAIEEAQRQYEDAEYIQYGISIYRTDLAWSELYALRATDLTH
jgi:hypothetical protein